MIDHVPGTPGREPAAASKYLDTSPRSKSSAEGATQPNGSEEKSSYVELMQKSIDTSLVLEKKRREEKGNGVWDTARLDHTVVAGAIKRRGSTMDVAEVKVGAANSRSLRGPTGPLGTPSMTP